MPGPWEDFAAAPAAPAADAGPWSDFKGPAAAPAAPAVPRAGAAAIPTEAEAAGQPYAPPVAVAPPKPAGFVEKLLGSVEAGLHLATSFTTGALGMAGGFMRAGAEGAGEGLAAINTVRDRKARGVPTSFPGDPGTPGNKSPGLEQRMNEGAEQWSYIPTSPEGVRQVEENIGPVMQALAPLTGHPGDLNVMALGAARDAGTLKGARAASQDVKAQAKAKADKLEAPKLKAIKEASEAGYVLGPSETRQGGVTGTVATTTEGLAGEPKIAKAASKKNAEVTERLVREDVGLPADEPISRESLKRIRSEAGEKYAVLKKIDTIDNDATYFSKLDEITSGYDTASESFPHRSENPFQKTIDGLRQKSMKGSAALEEVKLLRQEADKAYANRDASLGKAFKQAAEALDDSIDRHLTKMVEEKGADPKLADAVSEYRAARKQIAKTYQADAALNDTTGAIDAAAYRRALEKKKPLSGPGLTVARAAQAFPRMMQKPERLGNTGGPTMMDAGLAMLGGGKLDLATVGGRPAARAALLSKPVQKIITRRARNANPKKVDTGPAEPPDLTTSPGAGPGTPPAPPKGPGPLGDLTPDWDTTPGAGGGPRRGGNEPGLVRAVDEPSPSTGNRKSKLEIPAVPGRPDLPDTMVVGRPKEVAASDRANAAMDEPGARVARERLEGETTPAKTADEPIPAGESRELTTAQAEIERMRGEATSPAMLKVLDEHEKALKADAARKKAVEAAEKEAQGLEAAALRTTDPALRDRLRASADKLRKTEPIPKGEVKEGAPPIKTEKAGKIPAGEAKEIGALERVEAAPEPIPTPEVYEMTPEQETAWRADHKLGDIDAGRAKEVVKALQIDQPAVIEAARVHENHPRGFDRAIQDIIAKAKNADESKPAAQSSTSGAEGQGRGQERSSAPDAAADAARAAEPAGQDGAAVPRPGEGAVEIREVAGGFEAWKDGKKVGYLKDNLERGQAKQLDETANVDMVKVDNDVKGQGVGRALYAAFNDKHEGRIAPSGKTEPAAWALWKRNYPEKVDAFVKQEAARIRDGADRQLVLGNIKDPEVAQRVAQEAAAPAAAPAPAKPKAPHEQTEREFGADRQREAIAGVEQDLADAKAGKIQTGSFSRYKSKAQAVRDLTAELERMRADKPERFASEHLAEINKAAREGKKTIPENVDRYQLGDQNAADPKPDNKPGDLQQKAGEKGVPEDPAEEVFKEDKAEPFYSPLSRAIEGLKQGKGSAGDWQGVLRGLTTKGIKPEEIEWSGVNDWLKTQGKTVTKQELLDYLKEGGVKVEEVTKGGDRNQMPPDLQRYAELFPDRVPAPNAPVSEWLRAADRQETAAQEYQRTKQTKRADEAFARAEQMREMAERLETDSGTVHGAPKYATYQLPGGTNYREVLLTLPEKPKRYEYEVFDARTQRAERFGSRSEAADFASKDSSGKSFVVEVETGKDSYKSPHWQENNVLAHIRLNDRVDAQGRKVLFVEEVQSDWAQQGKKRGFTDGKMPARDALAAYEKELQGRYDDWLAGELSPDGQTSKDPFKPNMRLGDMSRAIGEGDKHLNLFQNMERERGATGQQVPAAPFVGKTDAWTALAIKRITKMAVDEGYDRVAFVNGEQSAARYDLSKHVDSVEVWSDQVAGHPETQKGEPKFYYQTKKEGRSSVGDSGEPLTADQLADHIGKELAAKAVEDIKAGKHALYEGAGLSVGGGGMKAFYDKIVPNVAKDVVRKLGGDGLTKVDLPLTTKKTTFDVVGADGELLLQTDYDSQAHAEARANPGSRVIPTPDTESVGSQLGFDITQKMRDQAEGGVPLFKSGERGAKPVGSPEALDKVLRSKFGDKLVQGLLDQGVLKFALALDEGKTGDQRGVKAVMRQGGGKAPAATLYFDRLKAEEAPGVLMHELGEHFGIVRLLGQERYGVMLNEMQSLKNTPEVKEAWEHVKRAYTGPDSGSKLTEGDTTFLREVAARLVEDHPDLPFVRRLINEIRAFFYEKFGTTLGNRADANLIRGLAAAALRKASTGELPKMKQAVRMLDRQPLPATRPAPSGPTTRPTQ